MQPRTGTIVGVVAGAVLLAAGAALFLHLAAPKSSDHDPATVALGQQLYAAHCAQCHGQNLEGQPGWRERRPDSRLPAPPHDPTGHTWHHPDAHIFAATKEGMAAVAPPGYESDMPAFKDVLTAAEINAVIAFIKSTWPERIRQQHEKVNAQAGQD